MTTRHEFLSQLHELLKPERYLEVGVQHGWSLQLSNAPISIGVDPEPLITATNLMREGRYVYLNHMTSDNYFDDEELIATQLAGHKIDLAFIDGMHLAEFAWRDFINISKYCHAGSVVVFDDVLPTTQEMASREQCPGDWTGDVWKLFFFLREETNCVLSLVDTTPTGTMVVTGFDQEELDIFEIFHRSNHPGGHASQQLEIIAPVPRSILDRRHAWSAPAVLENLKDRGFGA